MKRKTQIKRRVRALLLKQSKGGPVIDLSRRYHVISNTDILMLSTDDFSRAWVKIQGQKHGTRLIRNDGELLAYASTTSGGRVKKGFPKNVAFKGKLKVPKGF